MSGAPLLAVRNATRRFGAVTALDDVSLDLHAGEVVALVGDNGAGKSTLIKCVSGALRLHGGTIEIDGRPVALSSPAAARALGIETVYQDLALFDNLNPIDNFYAGREIARPRWLPHGLRVLRRREMKRTTGEVVRRLQVGLPDLDGVVGLLSGGQRQAIAVARAVTFATRLVILDEPTAALGVRETRNVLRLVKRLPERGISVLIISHNLEQVAAVADRVVVMRRGTKVGEAPPDAEHHDRIVSLIVGAQSGPL